MLRTLTTALFALALPLGALAAPIVATDNGRVAGVTLGAVSAFKGLPYAAAPTGANRWRAPQPVAPWHGVRAASAYASDCAQLPFPGDAAPLGTAPAEDCLYLNVWKPAAAKPGAKLPVMVWVHGGGFVNGGASPAVYDGSAFARDGVIMVGLNYRLGRFGFFAHPALAGEGGGGNFGFMDQVAALKWVQRNIAAFGGDPHNVTVFGESAGGMSMHVMLTSPIAKGLFDKVIIESGGGRDTLVPMATLADAQKVGEVFTRSIDAPSDAAALRALPAATIVGDLNMATMAAPGYAGPMLDGKTLWEPPMAAYVAGRGAPVPVIIGTNSADGFPFGTDKAAMFAQFGAATDQAKALYDADGSRTAPDLAVQIFMDSAFAEPARAVARQLSPRQPVWLYRFGYVATAMRSEWPGAPHASEIPYVMDTAAARYGAALTDDDRRAATLTHRYWVQFARTGTPQSRATPAWPKFDPAAERIQSIDASGAQAIVDPLTARLDFVEQRLALTKTP